MELLLQIHLLFLQQGILQNMEILIVNAGLDFQIGGNFNYNDSAGDLVWKANDIITVLGDFDINAKSFVNSGTISTDIFTIANCNCFQQQWKY